MKRRLLITAAPVVVVSGCASLAAIGKAAGVLNQDGTVNYYGAIRGIADMALIADPGLDLIIDAAFAVIDPIYAKVRDGTDTSLATIQDGHNHFSGVFAIAIKVVSVIPNAVSGTPS